MEDIFSPHPNRTLFFILKVRFYYPYDLLTTHMLTVRRKREISLEYLTEEKFASLSTTDEYFQVRTIEKLICSLSRADNIFI